MEDKNKVLREAAGNFALKASKLKSVLEIAIAGSVAGGDPYPGDLDISLVSDNLDELMQISKYARQMSRYYHGWEVFLFDKNLLYLGRVCYRRECPSQSVDCSVVGCGKPPHLKIISEFKYNEKIFLASPFDILYASFKESCLLARRDKLGFTDSRKYPVLEDVRIKCIICGRNFIFTAGEQKWYKKRVIAIQKDALHAGKTISLNMKTPEREFMKISIEDIKKLSTERSFRPISKRIF